MPGHVFLYTLARIFAGFLLYDSFSEFLVGLVFLYIELKKLPLLN